jgi:hypothetical protein
MTGLARSMEYGMGWITSIISTTQMTQNQVSNSLQEPEGSVSGVSANGRATKVHPLSLDFHSSSGVETTLDCSHTNVHMVLEAVLLAINSLILCFASQYYWNYCRRNWTGFGSCTSHSSRPLLNVAGFGTGGIAAARFKLNFIRYLTLHN